MSVCQKIDDCPIVSAMKAEIGYVREDYRSAQSAIIDNTKQLQQSEIAVVTMTGEIQHLCIDLKEYKNENKRQHDSFFKRLRENDKNSSKLNIFDLVKLIAPIIASLGLLFVALRYIGN